MDVIDGDKPAAENADDALRVAPGARSTVGMDEATRAGTSTSHKSMPACVTT